MTANPLKRSVALENASTVDGSSQPTAEVKPSVRSPLVLPAIIIAAVLIADQSTKIWAVTALTNQPSLPVIGDFFRCTLVYNYGGAMGTSFGPSQYYLVTALIILPLLFFYLWQSRFNRHVAIPLSFIAGGALGNVIDRVRLGKVIDFIDIDFFDIHLFNFQLDRWWTFNIADAAITCSIVFILISVLLPKKESQRELSRPTPTASLPHD